MIPDNSSFIEVFNFSSGLCDSSCAFPSPLSPALSDASCWNHNNGSGVAGKRYRRFLSTYRHPDGWGQKKESFNHHLPATALLLLAVRKV